MRRNAIIPETDRRIIPLDPDLDILTLASILKQELKQHIRFLIFKTDDLLREARVDEEGFVACCLVRMLVVELEGRRGERTGWMRTMGCSDLTGSRRTNFPSR